MTLKETGCDNRYIKVCFTIRYKSVVWQQVLASAVHA